MKERRRGVLITIIPSAGHAGRSWEIPRWLIAACVIGVTQIGLSAGLLGFYMQAQLGIRGRSAQWVDTNVREREHWGLFEAVMPPRRFRTLTQMRRRAALARALRLGLGTRQVATVLLGGHVEDSWRREVEARGKFNGTLLWPVRDGWFVRGYGAGEGGYHLAVDVMGERGTDVLAAADGVVGYASDTVRGYGNLVILIHPGGFITMYAHNERFAVVPGQLVKSGQVIAALGNTGISRGPHVHFEFMYGGNNCDPLALFRPGVRHRAGHLGEILQARWLPAGPQPVQVACERRRRHPHSRWGHDEDSVTEVEASHGHYKAERDQQTSGVAQLQQTSP